MHLSSIMGACLDDLPETEAGVVAGQSFGDGDEKAVVLRVRQDAFAKQPVLEDASGQAQSGHTILVAHSARLRKQHVGERDMKYRRPS